MRPEHCTDCEKGYPPARCHDSRHALAQPSKDAGGESDREWEIRCACQAFYMLAQDNPEDFTPEALRKFVLGLLDEAGSGGAAGCSFCKLGKCPYHESTIDQLRRENVRLDDKWRDYEENYILPCFAWARDAGIDLPTLVSEAKGNCVERLVQTLRAQRDEARKRLVQTLRAQGDEARTKLAAEPTWDDRPDEWTEAVKAAFPTRSGSHDEYALAMKMVGSRNGKGELVALVNWLLVRLSRATGSLGRSASYAPVKEDVKGEVGSGRSDECLRCGAPLGVLGTYCTDDAACREREALIRKACNLPPR